jgi:hypothetical protein
MQSMIKVELGTQAIVSTPACIQGRELPIASDSSLIFAWHLMLLEADVAQVSLYSLVVTTSERLMLFFRLVEILSIDRSTDTRSN